jgi:hypothetical protein
MTDSTLIHPSFESMADKRHADLVRFYTILTNLKTKIGDARKLASCSGAMDWPNAASISFLSKERIVQIRVMVQEWSGLERTLSKQARAQNYGRVFHNTGVNQKLAGAITGVQFSDSLSARP